MEAFMEEIKPAVTEKYAFEYRDKTVKITAFNFWDYRELDTKKKLNEVKIKYYSLSVDFFD